MPGVLSSAYTQSFRLPAPALTEKNLPSQAGRVFIITGGYAGVGADLCRILYGADGTVYVAGRSKDKADKAIADIKEKVPASKGKLEFLSVDLADLTTIKGAVESFTGKEERLDVLINNAGVMMPPNGSKTTQEHELQIGTNCLGPYLFTQLLKPVLTKTASLPGTQKGSVRVAWAGSLSIDAQSPKGGLTLASETGADAGKPKVLGKTGDYGQSKAGNYFLALESARHWGNEAGVLHVSFNPGNLKTELARHMGWLQKMILDRVTYPSVFGAYTELYCGWSEELSMQDAGVFVYPWGRKGVVRDDVQESGKDESGAKGRLFWEWCERESKAFA